MIRWFEKRRDLSVFVLVMIALCIFFVSSISIEPSPKAFGLIPTLYHIFAFFFLTMFLMISVVKGKFKEFVPIAFVMAVLYGVSDELHQFLVPGRAASVGDVFLDTIGITFASLIYLISLEFRK